VFIALSLIMMLPSSAGLFRAAFPHVDFPIASLVAATAFLMLLAMEHQIAHVGRLATRVGDERFPAIIPVTMTILIAVPSVFLGAALGISNTNSAILIFIAIMLHKSSAAFALTLQMVRSTMTNKQSWALFLLFACSTPLGIIVGQEIHNWLGMGTMVIVKGAVLGLAAGTFLFIATLHELQHSPMIVQCSTWRGFWLMVAGFLLTVLARFLMGEAHSIG
jgi:zinc transporter ZupT